MTRHMHAESRSKTYRVIRLIRWRASPVHTSRRHQQRATLREVCDLSHLAIFGSVGMRVVNLVVCARQLFSAPSAPFMRGFLLIHPQESINTAREVLSIEALRRAVDPVCLSIGTDHRLQLNLIRGTRSGGRHESSTSVLLRTKLKRFNFLPTWGHG